MPRQQNGRLNYLQTFDRVGERHSILLIGKAKPNTCWQNDGEHHFVMKNMLPEKRNILLLSA